MQYYFIIYKPYQVLSQFSPVAGKKTLADFFDVPKDVYPVGRLDYDSEGLLILTNDTTINHQLLHPRFEHEREYWIQVDGDITAAAIQQLQGGVLIQLDGKMYTTQPCKAMLFEQAPVVPERTPPIRFRKAIPAPWVRLILKEGKNRQVRKMTAKTGYPTIRLIRYRVEKLTVQDMQPGDMVRISGDELYAKLFGNR